jgi:hypothetical protein
LEKKMEKSGKGRKLRDRKGPTHGSTSSPFTTNIVCPVSVDSCQKDYFKERQAAPGQILVG